MSHSCDDPDMCTFDDEDGCDGPYEDEEMFSGCPFCAHNWENLTILAQPTDNIAVIVPLDPVTPGHVLVIARAHTQDAANDPLIAGDLMYSAAEWVHTEGIEANIITSIGRNATQSIMHTHVHVVPRRPHDGLPLPWTPQHEVKSLEKAVHLKTMLQESGGDSHSVGLFQQSRSTGWPVVANKFNVLKASRGEDPWEE